MGESTNSSGRGPLQELFVEPTASTTNDALREPLLEPTSSSNNDTTEQHQSPQQQRLWDGVPLGTSLLLKSLYFLQALGAASWGRFGTIYYNLHGLNSAQIGILEGSMPFVASFFQPVWGMIADHWRCRKAVYLFTSGVGTASLLSLAVPYIYASFLRIMIVSILSCMFAGSGILDSYTLDVLGTENAMLYGRFRMWSSISWGFGAIIMGYITDLYGFEPNFIIYTVLSLVCMFLIAWRIPAVDDYDTSSQVDTGKVTELICLMAQPRVMVFLFEIIIIGAGMATVERLLFLYMVNDLGSSTLLCGLSVGINVIFELPIFWYAESLTVWVGGHDGMIALALVCFVIRVFCYTLLSPGTVWFILPLEAMHGVTFACFWVTMTDISKALIDQVQGWNTTIPTIVQTLYSALGTGIGSIVGGWAMHRYGSRAMYRVAAGILFGTLLLHIFGSVVCRYLSRSGLLPDYSSSESSSSPPSSSSTACENEDEEEQQQDTTSSTSSSDNTAPA